MAAISTILQAQQRRRHARVLASTLAFILIALIAYLVLLGQGSVELSPRQVIDVLTGGGSETDPDVWYYTDDHYESFCSIPDAEE